MIQPIYLYGSEVLRAKAAEADLNEKERLTTLIQDLKDTLAKADGFDIAKAEAEAKVSDSADAELDGDVLKSVAGGHDYFCWHCPTDFDCTKNK